MKSRKHKIVVLTLALLCLCSVPVYALSLSYDSAITNTGSYVGGYSYTAGSGYDNYVVNSYLFEDGVIVDSDSDNKLSWAQADVGINNPSGTQYWNILGHHYAYLNGNQTFNTSNDYGQS